MKKQPTLLIIHGIQGFAGKHWQQWLHDQAINLGFTVIMPTLNNPYHPDRDKVINQLLELTKEVDFSALTIVAHSMGVAAGLDLIETKNLNTKGLISVAGVFKDYGAELNSYYLSNRNINFDKVNHLLENKFVIYGDNDPYVPQEVHKDLADKLNCDPTIIQNGGHLNTEAGYIEFPLLTKLLSQIYRTNDS